MATGVSGSFTLKGNTAGITCRVSYAQTYDVAANASAVTVRVEFMADDHGWYGYTYYLTGNVTVDGTQVAVCSSRTGYDRVRWNALNTYAYMQAGEEAASAWTKSGIAHGAAGGRSVTISVDLTGYTRDGQHGSGWRVSGSQLITLATIPRASGVGATDANVGAVSMVAVTRKLSTYTHSIGYKFGTLSGYLTDSGGVSASEQKFSQTSVAFTVPTSFYGQIPNAKSGTCTLTCRTYSGATQIGSATTCTFTVTAAESACAPQVSGTVVDANAVTKALTGDENRLVRYFSTALCTIAATARNGASIKTKTIAGTAVSGGSRSVENAETGSFRFSAEDSRGYTTAVTVTKPLVDYVRLTCDGTAKRAEPTSDSAVLTLAGNFFNASFGAAENTLAVSYRVAGGEETAVTPVIKGDMWSATAEIPDISYTRAYEITVTARDKLTSVARTVTVNRGVPVFDWGESDFRFNVPVNLAGGLGPETDVYIRDARGENAKAATDRLEYFSELRFDALGRGAGLSQEFFQDAFRYLDEKYNTDPERGVDLIGTVRPASQGLLLAHLYPKSAGVYNGLPYLSGLAVNWGTDKIYVFRNTESGFSMRTV